MQRLPIALIGATVIVSIVASSQSQEQKTDTPPIPTWLQSNQPAWLTPYLGKAGLSDAWRKRPGPLGSAVKGIDRYQANNFVVFRPETAKYLYPPKAQPTVKYSPGLLPAYEKAVRQFTSPKQSPREKAVALLRSMPKIMKHPTIPPCSGPTRPDRNLLDEPLLQSGAGWCNEQARVFVRLCQAAGIPARMIFLFYANERSGHVVAEFYADGGWCMADTSWFCVFPDAKGELLSAAQLHGSAKGKQIANAAYRNRFAELLKYSDKELTGGKRNPDRIRKSLQARMEQPEELGTFGVLEYPLPRTK